MTARACSAPLAFRVSWVSTLPKRAGEETLPTCLDVRIAGCAAGLAGRDEAVEIDIEGDCDLVQLREQRIKIPAPQRDGTCRLGDRPNRHNKAVVVVEGHKVSRTT